jgi:hypothetical protein
LIGRGGMSPASGARVWSDGSYVHTDESRGESRRDLSIVGPRGTGAQTPKIRRAIHR